MTATPLRAVLEAVESGEPSMAAIARRSGLDEQLVRAAVDHLVRIGRLEARELAMGCPASGCGGCASGLPDATPGCGAAGPSLQRRGPVLVALTLRH